MAEGNGNGSVFMEVSIPDDWVGEGNGILFMEVSIGCLGG